MLVKGHHDGNGAVTADDAGTAQEFFFAVFEGNGVDDTAARGVLQALHQGIPVAGINHNGSAGHIRVGSDITQEGAHTGFRVQHCIVHIHIDDVGTARDLGSCDGKGLFVVTGSDEAGEFAGAGDIGALADVCKTHGSIHPIGLQSTDRQDGMPGRGRA